MDGAGPVRQIARMQDGLLPEMLAVRQVFPLTPALDLPAAVERELAPIVTPLPRGATVAVAVGSRGITGLAVIVKAALDRLRGLGLRPFLVPAMGSHGGGTPEGQLAILARYGISEAALGVPVRAGMETADLSAGTGPSRAPFAAAALEADAILLINRVKPHTDFSGTVGSGLLKMLVVGLGKHAGASNYHATATRLGYEEVLLQLADVMLPKVPLAGGLAIIENQRHETARIVGVPAAELRSREPTLCAEAGQLMPRLPFDDLDLLIVDRMGKNISGTGMDPAVIGRTVHGYSLKDLDRQPPPRIRRLVVRELTPESGGNAIGIGMADFTTTRLVNAINWEVTRVNTLTAISFQSVKLPLHFATDREAIEVALRTLALPDPAEARVVRVRDTLSVEQFQMSPACRALSSRTPLVELGPPARTMFDGQGNLPE